MIGRRAPRHDADEVRHLGVARQPTGQVAARISVVEARAGRSSGPAQVARHLERALDATGDSGARRRGRLLHLGDGVARGRAAQ